MAKFIEVHAVSKNCETLAPIQVNVEHIAIVAKNAIILRDTGKDAILCEESYEEITRLIHAATNLQSRWVQDTSTGDDLAMCENCHEIYDMGDATLEEFAEAYKYCPNCGARMDLEGE